MARSAVPQLAPEGTVAFAVASAIGRRRLRIMRRSGLPAILEKPLEFLLGRSLSTADACRVQAVERLRADMAKRNQERVGVYSETEEDENATVGSRTLDEVAWISSVQPVWGAFLMLCAEASGAKTILELGGATGISGCYLASSPRCRRFVTIEGSSSRAKLATYHLATIAPYAEVVVDSFHHALDKLLPRLTDSLDLVYVDGSKSLRENVVLFDRISPHVNPGGVIIFDDIYWSTEMGQLWRRLCTTRGIAHAVNVGRMGVCVWLGGDVQPHRHDLYKIAGVDLYGLRYRLESWRSNQDGARWGREQ
ncbi:hypothetical protein YTPLAS18_28150 [Nitrospira sp.]|nr:hypothetical protein YTPLAS18_28150 [Nitrospira sp.]